jgi:tetratricopeptide (TPR) repeat protein
MPRASSSVASHLAVTDHRVLRRPDRPPPVPPGRPRDIPLVAFHRPNADPADQEHARDLALAAIHVAEIAQTTGGQSVAGYLARQALPLLDRAVARAPDDVPAVEARGSALLIAGRPEDALAALESVLARVPDRERTLDLAAEAATVAGRLDVAEGYARRAAEAYPHDSIHHEWLATIRQRRGDREGALEAASAAVRAGPFRPGPRGVLVLLHLEAGDRAAARAEFDTLGVLDPDFQARLRPRVAARLGGP